MGEGVSTPIDAPFLERGRRFVSFRSGNGRDPELVLVPRTGVKWLKRRRRHRRVWTWVPSPEFRRSPWKSGQVRAVHPRTRCTARTSRTSRTTPGYPGHPVQPVHPGHPVQSDMLKHAPLAYIPDSPYTADNAQIPGQHRTTRTPVQPRTPRTPPDTPRTAAPPVHARTPRTRIQFTMQEPGFRSTRHPEGGGAE